jgi:cytochrome d ubiquinol oxidase subunit II
VSLEVLAAGVVMAGLIAYAMFGGADFGGGVWTALAWGPRAARQREAIFRAMGPVWETNHVWLILVVVTLWTAFPTAFSYLFTALLVPLSVALLGIVFRGAAFAYRHFGEGEGPGLPATGLVFSVASILTPLFMGFTIGAVAGGHIGIEDGTVTSGYVSPWVQPFALISGLMAVAICAFLTASYMTVRTDGALRDDFRRRALASSLVLGGLTTLAILVARWNAQAFWDRLSGPAPVVVMLFAVASGLTSLFVLWRGFWPLAPPVAAGTVALVLAAWGVAQYPYFILPSQRISDLAANDTTLRFFLAALPIGSLILIPSLVLLYWTFSENTDPQRRAARRADHT